MERSKRILRFWRWFERDAMSLLRRPSLDIIEDFDERLQEIDVEISSEVSSRLADEDRELIITSHGMQSKFELIDEMVKLAPVIDGWSVQSLKPPRGFGFRVDGVDDIDLGKWKYVPLKKTMEYIEYCLRIEMPEQDRLRVDDIALFNIMEGGLGEVLFSLCSHVEYETSKTPGARPLDSLVVSVFSWAVCRGPASIKRFLPDVDLG